jgi:4-hydroxybenzoate polyprenyltransferase
MSEFWITVRTIALNLMGIACFFLLLALALGIGSILAVIIIVAVLMILAYEKYDAWRKAKRRAAARHQWR